VPQSVLDEHPALARYEGASVVLGIRSEDLTDAGDGARLSVEVGLRESVGSEVYVYFDLAAPPVVTEETREIAADLGDEVVGTLERRAEAQTTTWVARLPARTRAREGDRVDLALDPAGLHLFDPETGIRI
jgi:multiple sugar transport system ATP-binding protein